MPRRADGRDYLRTEVWQCESCRAYVRVPCIPVGMQSIPVEAGASHNAIWVPKVLTGCPRCGIRPPRWVDVLDLDTR